MILDTYAVLALLKGEPAASQVQQLLEEGDVAMTVLGIAEVVDHLVRLVATTEEDAALDIAQLGLGDPAPLDAGLALRAGLLRARQYHRTARAVSLADCVAAETARARGVGVVSADPHLLDLCLDEGIDLLPLPDSQGRTWPAGRS